MNPTTNGVLYVATGERYAAEAAESLALLRRTNPALPAALVTDLTSPPGAWDRLILVAGPTHSLRDKLLMRHTPWAHTLFLDTDTFAGENLDHLFALLEQFDVIGHQLFEGHDYELAGVSGAFPEFNTGVIGFRNTPALQQFFADWTSWYDRFASQTRCDQRSFRKALYHSGLRHSVLPPEYNFRPLATNFAMMGLHIVHGRPLAALPALKKLVDVNLVHRAYVPRLGCVVSDHMSLRQTWHLWCATSWELVKTATRPLRHALRRLLGQKD